VNAPAERMPTVVEGLKAASRGLRGTLAEELANDAPDFTGDATNLIKFHGFYQQDDRDIRRERASKKLPLEYSCMVRTSTPGGTVSADQWIAMDNLASEVADGSLRITTRQGIQFHFVHKPELRSLINTLNKHLVTTLAACGDVVRNVMADPAPHAERANIDLGHYARELSAAFKPTTRSYYDLFIDHESAASAVDAAPEIDALYGETYLPRKFKITFAWPGDNCVDLYAHDLGFVPILSNGLTGDLQGWIVSAGGGMGQNHAREGETYPRVASIIGAVGVNDLRAVGEEIIGIFRDFGDRTDRGRARLKYLMDDRGLDWFIAEARTRLAARAVPVTLNEAPALQPWDDCDEHLGWHPQTLAADGTGETYFIGVHVESGRVRDVAEERSDEHHGLVRTALRAIADSGLAPEFRLTARQDVLLCGVKAADRIKVENILRAHNVPLAHHYTPVRRLAMACPALPTCGQALAEAERILPRLADDAANALDKAGIGSQALRINVTGCPNGCARPYTSEVGLVGRGKRTYDLYIGGSASGDRLNKRLVADVHVDDLGPAMSTLFDRYSRERTNPKESFGDWSARVDEAELLASLPAPSKKRRVATEAE
jgi:sulfite reductase (ferredoxin)